MADNKKNNNKDIRDKIYSQCFCIFLTYIISLNGVEVLKNKGFQFFENVLTL